MSEVYNILIVGSYPIFLDAYKKALRFKNISSVMQNREIKIVTADNLISAFIEINNRSSKNFFDFILLDIDLPRCNKIKIKSGERLGDFIHEKNPETRILVVTSCINNLGLCNILAKICPDGLLIKTDLTNYELQLAVRSVISGKPYYSAIVNQLIKKKISQKVILDDIDLEILNELSNGAKMMELLQFIPLSRSGIEKRKRHLKTVLEVNSKSDRDLVLTARDKGFI